MLFLCAFMNLSKTFDTVHSWCSLTYRILYFNLVACCQFLNVFTTFPEESRCHSWGHQCTECRLGFCKDTNQLISLQSHICYSRFDHEYSTRTPPSFETFKLTHFFKAELYTRSISSTSLLAVLALQVVKSPFSDGAYLRLTSFSNNRQQCHISFHTTPLCRSIVLHLSNSHKAT